MNDNDSGVLALVLLLAFSVIVAVAQCLGKG